MTIDGKIKDEKLWFELSRETAKMSQLSSWKIDINMNILQVKKC